MDIQLAPSILAADFTRLGEQVQAAEVAGASRIHIDVMDGRFVPNITMGPLVVDAVRRVTDLPLDVHLMIVNPADHVAAFAKAGADIITAHLEADANLHRTIMHIHDQGCKAGVAINPHTPTASLESILQYIEQVIVMTVNPGFGGQSFIPEMLAKVVQIRAMSEKINHAVDIEVDGGINVVTALKATQAGANILIAGSAVFGHEESIAAGMDALRHAITE